MDYEDYTPDSTRVVKSGRAYRLLGHDYATYYQYAIYVSRPTHPRPAAFHARTPNRNLSFFFFFFVPRGKKNQE